MKNSILTLTLIVLICGFTKITHAQELIYANRIGSDTPDSEFERGQCITTDSDGSVYISGTIGQWTQNAVLGAGEANETELSEGEAFIAKYNATGELVWAQEIGTLNKRLYCYAMDVDVDGNVYASGTFYEQAVFGLGQTNETTLSGVSNDIFIAKYDNNGQLIWAINEGGDGDDNPGARDLKVDTNGNIFVTGCFDGEVTFGKGGTNETALVGERHDIFIAKYDTNGVLQWVKQEGGSGVDSGKSIELDSEGNIFMMGNYFNLAVFGKGLSNETTLNNVNESAFIAKYNPSGNLLWAMSPYHNYHGADISGDIVIDKDNSLIFTGSFWSNATFIDSEGTETILQGHGGDEFVVVKYTNDGLFIWAKSVESSGDERGQCIALDEHSNIFVGGYFGADIKFGMGERNETSITHTGSGDGFIAKYSPAGEFIWANTMEGEKWDETTDIAIDTNGDANIIGFITGDVTLGRGETNETTLAVKGANDILFAKYRKSFNASPEFDLSGETTFQEDFEGSNTIVISQINTPEEEKEQTISYSILPSTSEIVDFSFDTQTGELVFNAKGNAFGTEKFTITADDGGIENYSYVKELSITIEPVNDAPQVKAYKGELSFKADESLLVEIADLEIEDADNNDEFTLTVLEGENYTVTNNEVSRFEDKVGEISVALKVNDGELDSEVFNFTCEIIGVQGIDNAYIRERFNIYPNPAYNLLNVVPNQEMDYQIKLYSISGNLVYRADYLELKKHALDISSLAKGVYILRIDTEGKAGVFKIVKK